MADGENRFGSLTVYSPGVGLLGFGLLSGLSHIQHLSLPPTTGSLGGMSIVRVCSMGTEAKSKHGDVVVVDGTCMVMDP